jgi:Holliday junction resolvase RusA-like endonuclease
MLTKTFTLPSLPVSSNRLHNIDHRRRRVFVSDEARQWANRIWPLIPRFDIPETSLLRIDYVASYQWFHANGKRRRKDPSNLMKLLHDTVCARIGVDDSRVVAGSFAAVDAVEESIQITLTEIV